MPTVGNPSRVEVADCLRSLADRVAPSMGRTASSTHTAAMSEEDFWRITEPYGWGTKTKNYKIIEKDLLKKLTPEEGMGLREMFDHLTGKLYHAIGELSHDTELGDDGYSDLLAHIVGLGKREYEAVLRNPQLAVDRALSGKFTESFSYAIPHKADFKNLDVHTHIERAERIIKEYEMLLTASEEDIPWLPRMKGMIEKIIKDLQHFIHTKDHLTLLGEEEELKLAAETIEKYLRRLSASGSYMAEDNSLEGAIHQCSNKWMVWNLLSDLRHYLG